MMKAVDMPSCYVIALRLRGVSPHGKPRQRSIPLDLSGIPFLLLARRLRG